MKRSTGSGPLNGIKVLELGQLIAGPFCGQLLGDMGAEVVKVEPPVLGDPLRQWGSGDAKVWWEVLARNKKSVSANLRDPRGQSLVRALASTADILIENFRPGTLEKWDLSPETLMASNPRLIVVRVSGYGQTGPYADRPGFGGIGEAMGGLRHIVGEADRAPARVGISIGDTLAGTFGAMGALAALEARHKTGCGQVVDVSLFESVLQVMEALVPEYTISNLIRERTGAILPGIAPSNAYPCKDGTFLIAANQDAIFKRLCEAMGKADLASDPNYGDHISRGKRQADLDAMIADWTRTLLVDEVEALTIAHAIPSGRVYRAPDMLADPHFAARQSIISVEHPQFGTIEMQNAFPIFSDTPAPSIRPAPSKVGQNNEEVYGALSISTSEMAVLQRDNVI